MLHLDSIASVLFWLTLIFTFGLAGRYLAYFFEQPAVLGELLMGVVLGNSCYWLMIPHVVILREGANFFSVIQHVLAGWSLPHAVSSVVPNSMDAARILTILHSEQAFDVLQVAQAMDIFSRLEYEFPWGYLAPSK